MGLTKSDVVTRIKELENDLARERGVAAEMQAVAQQRTNQALRIEGALLEMRELLTSPHFEELPEKDSA